MKKTIFLLLMVVFLSRSFAQNVYADEATDCSTEERSTYEDMDGEEIEPYRYYYTLIPKRVYEVPEDVINGSTEVLWDFFFLSNFVGQDIFCRSTPDVGILDYTIHPAFAELVSRDDFPEVLRAKIAEVNTEGDSIIAFASFRLAAILEQPAVQKVLESGNHNRAAFYNNGIGYSIAGTVNTVSNNSVIVYTADREWTSAEKSLQNALWYPRNPLHPATTKYNCHSYAWYRYTAVNPYWIDGISPFLNDSACNNISASSVQIDDIVVYYNSEGLKVHSGVVYSLNGGTIQVCSKWGQSGVYIHDIDDVPNSYYYNPNTQTVSVSYYRYHGYSNQYAGQNYHSGQLHYYKFADTCVVCGKQTNFTWISQPCSGPPCPMPYRIIPFGITSKPSLAVDVESSILYVND